MDSNSVRQRRFAIQVFAAAVSVRVRAIIVIHVFPGVSIYRQDDPEVEHFARTLLAGGGWTNPYLSDDAIPSALRGPIPSLLLAGILWLTGESGSWFRLAAYLLYSIVSAATAVAAFFLGARFFGFRVGRVAAVMLALYPASIYYAANAMSDATLASASLVALTLAVVRLVDRNTIGNAALTGLIAGIGALINPSILSVLVALLIWWVARSAPAGLSRRLPQAAALAGVGALVVSPWLVRNRIAFGEWVFIRSNFGMELRGGNREEGVPFVSFERFHMSDSAELNRLHELGEPRYSRECTARAFDWIREDPHRFLRTTAQRFMIFWGKEVYFGHYPIVSLLFLGVPLLFGGVGVLVALHDGLDVAPLVIPLVAYPLVYYITHAQARFRFPIDVFLLIFAAFMLTRITDFGVKPKRSQLSGSNATDH